MRQTIQTAGPKEAQTEEPACSSTVKEDSREEVILQLRSKDEQGHAQWKEGASKTKWRKKHVPFCTEGTACVKAWTEWGQTRHRSWKYSTATGQRANEGWRERKSEIRGQGLNTNKAGKQSGINDGRENKTQQRNWAVIGVIGAI